MVFLPLKCRYTFNCVRVSRREMTYFYMFLDGRNLMCVDHGDLHNGCRLSSFVMETLKLGGTLCQHGPCAQYKNPLLSGLLLTHSVKGHMVLM